MKLTRLALAVAALSVLQPVVAEEDSLQLGKSIVTGNRLAQEDFVAPYASEVHNFEDIQKSGAISLYDYLGRFSSVNVTAGAGNQFQQKLDMRGYGIGDGYQNIVVTLNGRRLNNIDQQAQLLGSIPLASIERIEVIKGSGSVAQGDGAMAGVINIVTRDITGAQLSMAAGSDGYQHTSVAAGLAEDKFALQLLADNSRSDGVRKQDINGKTDKSDADNLSLDFKLKPLDGLELRVGKDRSRIETNYGSSLTKEDFYKEPELNGWTTEQELEVDTNRFGASWQASEILSFNLDHAYEKKSSEYVGPGSEPTKYKYRSTDFSSQLNLDQLTMVGGVQLFDGERKSGTNKTTKDNLGVFVQAQYRLDNTLLSAGVRREHVKYNYKDVGVGLKNKHKETVWELGANHQYSDQLSVFANISQGFQAPDIDRPFGFDPITYDQPFNGFLAPAKSKNLNLGLHHVTDSNQLKVTAFYSRLRNEIYYFSAARPTPSYNTNIDKSHKYGLEVQDRYQFNDQLAGRVNYAWTVAKIDREDEGSGAYNGKKLPGVSAHSITAGLDYKVVPNGTLSLTQNWRSSTYAESDFENKMGKTKAFNTTDLGYSHQIQQFTLFAQVNNVFDKKNGLYVYADYLMPPQNVVYPVNFTRTWYAGVRASF